MAELRIVAAAIRYRVTLPYASGQTADIIVSSPPPGRHHTIVHGLIALADHQTCPDDEPGFLTSEGAFVNRREACVIARAAGQIKKSHGDPFTLYSEDMW